MALGILLSLIISLAGFPGNAEAQANTPLDKLKAMAADSTKLPDLAEVALLGAQLIRPAIEPDVYLKRLDAMADEVNSQIQGITAAVDAVNALSNYIYNIRGYANSAVLSADVFVGLDQVLEGQQWNCVGMSLLYAALGKRTNIPLNMVAGHGHVFVAYTGVGTFYLETTAGGRLESDRGYLREYLPFPCVNPANYVTLDEREAASRCLSQMGLAMQHENRVQLAKTLFNLALDFTPDHAEAIGGLAFIQAAEGKTGDAIKNFEKAIQLDPDFREGYGGLGNALNARGDTTGAVEAYRTLVSLCPDDETSVFNMGQLLYDIGDLDGSIAAYERYIELEPRDPEGYMRIAFPLEDSGNLERAAEAYDRVLQLAPNHVNALSNLGHVFEELGNLDAAMDAYQRALDVQPYYLQAMAGVGRVFSKTNRFYDAVQTFQGALRRYPNEAFLLVDLGRVLEDYGDLKQAISAYQEATRVAPADTEGYYALAGALGGLGLNKDAEQVRGQARAIEAELARREAIPLPVPSDTSGNREGPAASDTSPPMEPSANDNDGEGIEKSGTTVIPEDATGENTVKESDITPPSATSETTSPPLPNLPSTKPTPPAPKTEKPVS